MRARNDRHDSLAKKALLDTVLEVARERELAADFTPLRLDLASGLAGQLILYGHLVHGEIAADEFYPLACRELARISAAVSNCDRLDPGLFTGVTGIAWAMRHVATLLNIGDWKSSRSYEPIFEYVSACVTGVVELEFDLIRGLAGIGLWGLSIDEPQMRTHLVHQVLGRLAASAESADEGVAWRTPLRRFQQQGRARHETDGPEYDLGIAHGVAGVIGFLANCVAQRVHVDVSTELLSQAMAWFECQSLRDDSLSVFPTIAGSSRPSRLAWCYGDAGIALSLHRGACSLKSPRYFQLVRSIMRRISQRRLEDAMAYDGGLCHGAAGITLLCSQLARAGGPPSLLLARNYWLNELLKMRREDQGLGIFPRWSPVECRLEPSTDLLTGSAGIGLTLLSQLTRDYSWAYPFLAD